jgi:hypothetical protein
VNRKYPLNSVQFEGTLSFQLIFNLSFWMWTILSYILCVVCCVLLSKQPNTQNTLFHKICFSFHFVSFHFEINRKMKNRFIRTLLFDCR